MIYVNLEHTTHCGAWVLVVWHVSQVHTQLQQAKTVHVHSFVSLEATLQMPHNAKTAQLENIAMQVNHFIAKNVKLDHLVQVKEVANVFCVLQILLVALLLATPIVLCVPLHSITSTMEHLHAPYVRQDILTLL